MNTLLQDDLQHYALHLLLFSVQTCIAIIMDNLPSTSQPSQAPSMSASSKNRKLWSEQEIADLVDFLYEHRSEGSGGNFKEQTYTNLFNYLATRHPGQGRSRQAIQSKFCSVSFFRCRFSRLTGL
jgi:hypothetical protein